MFNAVRINMKIMSQKENKSFIEYLNSLKRSASANPVYKSFTEYERFFEGKVRPVIKSNEYSTVQGNEACFYNVIKPIIETKATIALDNQITTSVKPTSLSHANFNYLKEIENVAEILNDVWDSVKRKTELQELNQRIVRDGLIYGIGVAKTAWDQTKEDGLGDVSITRISPQDFFPEPQATSIQNANYIFVRRVISKFDLINQYKGNKKVIDIISKLNAPENKESNSKVQSDVVATFTNSEKGGQAYLEESSFLGTNTKHNVEIWECYLKDDTVFVAQKDDSTQDQQVKKKEIFKYPNGRLIIYSGNHILEDKPLDYPFGFPFAVFQPTQSNNLVGYGDVHDLMYTQSRLTDAYLKLSTLLMKYKSLLLVSPDSVSPGNLEKDFDIIYTKPGPVTPPQLITNKLTDDIQIVRQHISDLKNDALKIARINEILLSGERPVGVNSGKMVQDLIESPLSAIREIQRNFKQFLVNISNKSISLIQLYYNQPRILRLSGARYAGINVDDMGNTSIDIMDETGEAINTIMNDFSIAEYEVEVQTGSALPQSQQALAAITMQLAKDGIFGDINNPDVKELILKTLDYPNYHAILEKMKEDEIKMAEMPVQPQFSDYLKNLTMSLGDVLKLVDTLDPQTKETAKLTITDTLGITFPPTPEEVLQPMQEMTPPMEEMLVEDTIESSPEGVEEDTTFIDFSQN